jgi:hypothetical protein
MIASVLIPVAIGLLVNELCDVSPWLARKLVRWSAYRRYADPARAEARAEELTAVINARPGNLFKLITAVGFAASAAMIATRRDLSAKAGRAAAEATNPSTHYSHARRRSDPEILAWLSSHFGGNLSEAESADLLKDLPEYWPRLRMYGVEEIVKRMLADRGHDSA